MVFSFSFFLLKRRAFSGSGILIFFFFIPLLPHLSHLRASHISHKKIISVRVAENSEWHVAGISSFSIFMAHVNVWASPQVLGAQRGRTRGPHLEGSAIQVDSLEGVFGGQGVCDAVQGPPGRFGSHTKPPSPPPGQKPVSTLPRRWGPRRTHVLPSSWARDEVLDLSHRRDLSPHSPSLAQIRDKWEPAGVLDRLAQSSVKPVEKAGSAGGLLGELHQG